MKSETLHPFSKRLRTLYEHAIFAPDPVLYDKRFHVSRPTKGARLDVVFTLNFLFA